MNDKKIIHLATDEKFIDMGMDSFKLSGYKNELFVFGKFKRNFIKSRVDKNIKLVSALKGINIPDDCDLIIIHSLNYLFVETLLKVKVNIPILWIGWGYDYYEQIGDESYLLPKSKRLNDELKSVINLKKIKSEILRYYFTFRLKKVVGRIDFFAPVIVDEYASVREFFNLPRFPEVASWNYGTIEEHWVKGFCDEKVEGSGILLGNSSTFSNNHIEAIDLLAEILEDQEVLSPLGYGDDQYRQYIIDYGRNKLRDKFVPLTDYLPIDAYIDLLKSCSYVVMNHVRQQAVGNIILMLYLGAKLFLRSENVVYQFLKSNGAVVYTVEELIENPALLKSKISNEELLVNRSVLNNFWSTKASISRTKQMLGRILTC